MILKKYLISKHCSTCCDDDLEDVIVELPVEVEREPAAAAEDPLDDGEDKCRYLSYFCISKLESYP